MLTDTLRTLHATPVLPLLAAAALLFSTLPAVAQEPLTWKALPTRTGPVVTEEQFFAALDLARPGLEAVRAAVERADYPAAKAALVAYYRARTRPGDPVDPNAPIHPVAKDPSFDTSRADDLVRGKFSHWLYPDVVVDFSKGTDWALLPVRDREWAWVLNRHHQWDDLAEAYLHTGDEKYARAVNNDLISWVQYAAVPEKPEGSQTPTWRTIEAGIRLGQTWMPAYSAFLASPSFTEEARILFYKSVLEHARFLQANPSGGNWLTMEMNGLAHAAVLFPEFKEAAAWRDYAYGRLAKELTAQVYPDGAQFELTTSYHNVALGNFLAPAKLAKGNNIALPGTYMRDIEKMFVFDMYMAKPNGALPAFNDSDPDFRPRAGTSGSAYLREGADLFGREDFRFVGTRGAGGKPPAETSHAFPYAGFLVMRSGWDKDARYLAFDAGPFGAGHQHEDKLSFELCAYDRTFLVDPGRGAYAASPWRSFFVGTSAHNTLMIDGQGQMRRSTEHKEPWVVTEPLPHTWVSSPAADYAEAAYTDTYGQAHIPATHTRRILFVKPGYWLVADRVDGTGRHKVESLLHFAPGMLEQRTGTAEVRTVNADGPNLSVRPLSDGDVSLSVHAGEDDPVQGWIAPDYDTRLAAPVAVFTAEADLPYGLGLALLPAPAGQSPGAVARLDVTRDSRKLTTAEAVACRVLSGDHADDVCLANGADPALCRFGGHATDGRAAIVRCEAGRLRSVTLISGRTLSVAGSLVLSLDAESPVATLAWDGGALTIDAPDASGTARLMDARRVMVNGVPHDAPAGAKVVRFSPDRSVRFEGHDGGGRPR